MAKLSIEDCEKLLRKKDKLLEKYIILLRDDKFVDIITRGTAAIINVKGRYEAIHKLFQEVLMYD